MAKKEEIHCIKEAEIASMHTTMEAIAKVVFGNGKDGLNVSVPLLSKIVDGLRDGMVEDREIRKAMKTTLSAMMKYQDDECVKNNLKEEQRKKDEKRRDRKLNIFLAVIATIAVIVPIILAIVL